VEEKGKHPQNSWQLAGGKKKKKKKKKGMPGIRGKKKE